MKYLKWILFASIAFVSFFISDSAFAETNQPTITYHNIKLDDKTTTENDLSYLLNNPNQRDIDFYLTGTEQEPAYFQYDFPQEVVIIGSKLTGWWANQQGISKMKLQYLAGNEWKDLSEEITLDWRDQGSGPETIKVGTSNIIATRGVRVVALEANHKWSSKVTMHEVAPILLNREGEQPQPAEIKTSNLKLTSGRLDYLTKNAENKDIDFQPEKGYDQAETYLEYHYSESVYLNELHLVGWYPKDQAIKNLSVAYFENGVWKTALPDTELLWKTPQGTQKQEELIVPLRQGVITNKLRVTINGAYQSWGTKLNMRLLNPSGRTVSSQSDLQKRIETIKLFEKNLLLGTNFGEYPESKLTEIMAFGSELTERLEAGIDPEEMPHVVQEADSTLENFYNSKNSLNPKTTPAISFENVVLDYGQALNLIDHQLATSSDLKIQNSTAQASIDFDFTTHSISLTGVIINCNTPKNGLEDIQIQVFTNGAWQTVGQKQVVWKNTTDLFAGVNVPIAKVTTSKIRLLINKEHVSLSEISFIGKID